MKSSRKMVWLAALVAAPLITVLPAQAGSSTSVVGHVDLDRFAFIMLPVDDQDVAPYLPQAVKPVVVDGRTTLLLFFGVWSNLSVDGIPHHDAGPFWESELLIPTYGPEGSGIDSGGAFALWRLAASPLFPQALTQLGLTCGGEGGSYTQVCHVPEVTGTVAPSPGATRLEVSVPWTTSPYTASATYLETTLPCAFCNSALLGWHLGSRGFVRETVSWSAFPAGAIIGVGIGTVHAPESSPLYRMLGGREEAIGPAIVLRAHADGLFELV